MIELPPLRSSWIAKAILILLPTSNQSTTIDARARSVSVVESVSPVSSETPVMFVYINIPNTAITGSVTFPSSGFPRGKVRKIEAS
ncbi:hypothetical protein A7U60_g8658 [Sanghuangporus baumii]|uniref:Secreted protein n=1 Tax=Sanghuangporus baumii TaxID=108892 RepID=A0A9Q5MXJ9_SANBA|nr:hypothetical protein A7U60_g8658 [Sanghuangporus baumii]